MLAFAVPLVALILILMAQAISAEPLTGLCWIGGSSAAVVWVLIVRESITILSTALALVLGICGCCSSASSRLPVPQSVGDKYAVGLLQPPRRGTNDRQDEDTIEDAALSGGFWWPVFACVHLAIDSCLLYGLSAQASAVDGNASYVASMIRFASAAGLPIVVAVATCAQLCSLAMRGQVRGPIKQQSRPVPVHQQQHRFETLTTGASPATGLSIGCGGGGGFSGSVTTTGGYPHPPSLASSRNPYQSLHHPNSNAAYGNTQHRQCIL